MLRKDTSRLSENPEKLPLGSARLPNLAISSGCLPCSSLDLAIQASNSPAIRAISFLSDKLLGTSKINTVSIPTRYPEDLQLAVRDYPKSVAKEYLSQTQEIIQWLKQHPNLNS